MIKKIPLPIAGLILALVTMGNMFSYLGNGIRYTLGIISAALFIALIVKILINFDAVKEELKNPVILTVMGTLDMALIVLSTYLASFAMTFGKVLWIIGVILHVILIIFVTIKYIFKFNIKSIFATYFVSYVGIAVASITAPVFSFQAIGKVIFYFGITSYIVLIPIVFYRVYKVKNMPAPAFPTNIIIAAPASLCLAGYVNSFGAEANPYFVIVLGVVALIMTILGIMFLPKVVGGKFYPSFAALTFPFVISPFAMRIASTFLLKNESFQAIGRTFGYIYNVEAVFAVLIVIFVFAKYIIFMFELVNKKSVTA